MRRRERAFGTNRDMAHSNQKAGRHRELSDEALLRSARKDAAKWQDRLAKQRRAEQ